MVKESPTKEEFLKDIHKEFPMLEGVREWELNKIKFKLLDQSSIGKAFTYVYLFIAIISMFIYWKVFNFNIILSLFLAVITWFIVRYFDIVLVKISGIDHMVDEASKKDIDESLEKLKGHGMIK